MNRVKAGFFSMAGASPASYLAWHALDHMPEQYSIPGLILGQRWGAKPEWVAARAFASPELAPIRFVVLYLMTEPVAETIEQFVRLGRTLTELGRYPERVPSHFLGAFDLVDARGAARVHVSDEVVPFRPHRGVYVIVSPEPGPHTAAERLVAVDGVAGVWSFTTTSAATNAMWTAGTHRVTICYLDGDPLSVAAAIEPVLSGEPLLAGPFQSMVRWDWEQFAP